MYTAVYCDKVLYIEVVNKKIIKRKNDKDNKMQV